MWNLGKHKYRKVKGGLLGIWNRKKDEENKKGERRGENG
jgi:hypothetical protein